MYLQRFSFAFLSLVFLVFSVPFVASASGTYPVKQGGSTTIYWSVTGAIQCQGTTPDYPNISDGVYSFWANYHSGTGSQAGTFSAPGGLYTFTCSAPNATSPTVSDTATLGVVAPPAATDTCNSSDVITVTGTLSYPSLSSAAYPIRIQDTTVLPTWTGSCAISGAYCNDSPSYPFTYQGIPGHTYHIWAHTLWSSVWSDPFVISPDVTCPMTTSPTCGTANKTYPNGSTSYGSDTFCSVGTASPTSPAFPAAGSSSTWTCSASGTSVSCSASQASASSIGTCGTANGVTYPNGATSYGSDTQCAPGTSSNTAFPAAGATVTWTCSASGGTSGTCSASQAASASCTVSYVCSGSNSIKTTSTCSTITTACANGCNASTGKCYQADLTASWVSPTSATVGTPAALTANVTNQGTYTTGTTFLTLFQTSPDKKNATDIGTVSTPILAAGANTNVTFNYSFPSSGTVYARACADKSSASDTNGQIGESNEGNNCSNGWVAISVAAGTGATVSASSTTGASPTSCVITTAGTKLCNITLIWNYGSSGTYLIRSPGSGIGSSTMANSATPTGNVTGAYAVYPSSYFVVTDSTAVTVLATSATVNVTCGSGLTWDSASNTCKANTGCANNSTATGVALTLSPGSYTQTAPSGNYKNTNATSGGNYCWGNSGALNYFVPQNSVAEFQSFWTKVNAGTLTGIAPIP